MVKKKFRIGNDIAFEWALTSEDGTPYDLTGRKLLLFLVSGHRFGRIPIRDFTVCGNVVSWIFYGKDQPCTGNYDAMLVENSGEEGMVTVDVQHAVELVPHSWQQGVLLNLGVCKRRPLRWLPMSAWGFRSSQGLQYLPVHRPTRLPLNMDSSARRRSGCNPSREILAKVFLQGVRKGMYSLNALMRTTISNGRILIVNHSGLSSFSRRSTLRFRVSRRTSRTRKSRR